MTFQPTASPPRPRASKSSSTAGSRAPVATRAPPRPSSPGLAGKSQSAFDAAALAACHAQVDADGAIALGGRHRIGFVPGRDIAFRVDRSPGIGGNALRFVARDAHGGPLASRWYLSIGDGEVIAETERGIARQGPRVPFPFASADELLAVTPGARARRSRCSRSPTKRGRKALVKCGRR
jgi:hypothetical protein